MDKDVLNSKLTTIKLNHDFSKFQKKFKKGVVVQSLLFAKDKFTVASAIAWAKKKGFKYSKVDVPKTGKNIRLRQKEPGRFTAFRTIVFGKWIKAIIATNKLSKFTDRKGYTLGTPYLKEIEGSMWIFVPGEITNRDMAYQVYIMNERGNPL